MDHLNDPVRAARQKAHLREAKQQHNQPQQPGTDGQTGGHAQLPRSDGQQPQPEHEQGAEQHVKRDETERVANPEQ